MTRQIDADALLAMLDFIQALQRPSAPSYFTQLEAEERARTLNAVRVYVHAKVERDQPTLREIEKGVTS